MLIRESISGYKHLDFGNIKLAFTRVCKDELFKDVYFAANSLYYVQSGSTMLHTNSEKIHVSEGEIVLIRQHSKLNIQKFKSKQGEDFRSIIFYLFPDFVLTYLKQAKENKTQEDFSTVSVIPLGKHEQLKTFCESLLPLFDKKATDHLTLKQKTFEALDHLAIHNKDLCGFLLANSKPVKIDLYEFMIHITENNYTVNELSQLTGRSLSAFKRDFYTVFETTPHQWLLDKKIEQAEQLMKEKKMKASEIYHMLGFNELSHFSAAFKKKKGISPTQVQA